MSNGSAAAALMVTVAMLTGMAHLHGSSAGRHASTRQRSGPGRTDRTDGGDRIGHGDRGGRIDRGDRTGLTDLTGRTGRTDRTDRTDRTERADKTERVELGDARIPVRTVRRPYGVPGGPRSLYLKTPEGSPEVIVGYVNPARGSTAFHRLTNVVEGDRVKVVRRDHRVDWFKVDSIRREVSRSIAEERSPSGRPELRLISWRGARSPRNVVV
ncbi:MAG: hypothetical protein ACRDP6_43240, partial [Actinoallomurus sp.]